LSRHYQCASPTDCYGCLVHTNGQVRCSGDNIYGQLGVGVRAESSTDPVSDLPQAQKVVTGPRHACALTRSGDVYCWGSEEGLAQEPPEQYCAQVVNGNCADQRGYSSLPLRVSFDEPG